MTRPPMAEVVGAADIVWVTLDTLRHDVATRLWADGRTPYLRTLIPGGWERRHTPGSFTYAAHHAFLAGFLPTPADDPQAERLFAVGFPGSETTGADTWVTSEPDIPTGLAAAGYRTICSGGVGFFNPDTPLGSVLPSLFHHRLWSRRTSVVDPDCLAHQTADLADLVAQDAQPPVFALVNVATLHQPNCHYLPGRQHDDLETHAAALEHVDAHLPDLVTLFDRRPRPTLWLLMSDHGTCYGDDGYHGHRLAHEVTWTVPYAEVWRP